MRVFYCLRIERNISLFKRRVWTCLYNVGPRSITLVLRYEVQHYILETKWRRMRGRTWLERNADMPMFSSKNSEKYKMVEPGDIWGDSSDKSVFLVYLSLFSCAWFADLKREITLDPLRSKTRYSFSVSLPKKFQCMLQRRCLSTMRAIFSKLAFGLDFRPSPITRSEDIALAVKRPRSPPCYS